jgi:prepilin-type N-terminal cleavage/methylation domain-containing protein
MTKKFKKGFTLIELLVVIAIIGILSAVVLASLNQARAKGADANIKSNLANIRSQAEILYDSSQNYDGLCGIDNVVAQMGSANTAAGLIGTAFSPDLGTDGSATQSVCHVSADLSAWAAGVPLKSNSDNSWCVDSTGASREVEGYLLADESACPPAV